MSSIQELFRPLAGMQWQDYLDILLVACLIYRLLPLVRTPSTMRIFRTVLGILVITWLTGYFKLHTLNYILNQFLAVGILAFVILFQPELRRVLNHLGNVKLRSLLGLSKPEQEMSPIITQTVRACEIMSQERIGALIVFAREARLEEFFKTGTQIDGQVSEQLIRNIFFPKAALHDGAMIIRDGRVAAAGCVLPLSESVRLSADLGTRHRAGVGMSEVSDAVVVIVSEETGTISVAVGGMLKRHLTARTLERLLKNELSPDKEREDNQGIQKIFNKLTDKQKEADPNEK